jgi:hypothetical protein
VESRNSRVDRERDDVDYGFQTAAARPDEYNKGDRR